MNRDHLAILALRIAMRTALAMTRDSALAEDIAQDTAIEVLRNADAVRDPNAALGWIHKIAVNRTVRALRDHGARKEKERIGGMLLLEATGDMDRTSPGPEFRRTELRRELLGALASLPLRQRLVMVLRHVHDLSYAEISDVLDVPIGTVGALLSRAHGRMRAALAAESEASGAQEGIQANG